jgi:hypothetical protein
VLPVNNPNITSSNVYPVWRIKLPSRIACMKRPPTSKGGGKIKAGNLKMAIKTCQNISPINNENGIRKRFTFFKYRVVAIDMKNAPNNFRGKVYQQH